MTSNGKATQEILPFCEGEHLQLQKHLMQNYEALSSVPVEPVSSTSPPKVLPSL